MTFKFKCKYNHLPHEAVTRARESTSNGTSSLLRTAQQCDSDRGIVAEARATGPSYSVAAHRTLIAMRTATSNRPFNAVNDKYYRMEVEMLRPGTSLPAASTVSRDLNLLYLELSKDVRSYFKVCMRPLA
ncbi:hypothetical protein C8R46DRAFT_880118 [Mycena filopes]|nr:hypothetical protein C8R46DRAFT_916663 [Mycena filopes]KAJ7186496.1 hypothetical protein C8R46DRAFT_880118 [Mycena filopes]